MLKPDIGTRRASPSLALGPLQNCNNEGRPCFLRGHFSNETKRKAFQQMRSSPAEEFNCFDGPSSADGLSAIGHHYGAHKKE